MRQNVDIGPEYFPGANVSTDAEILHLIRQSFNALSHPTSTCKMGKSNDTEAVVDPQGRVYGVKGLRVVDASSFPFLPPGLPMGTVCECSLPVTELEAGKRNKGADCNIRYVSREDRRRYS